MISSMLQASFEKVLVGDTICKNSVPTVLEHVYYFFSIDESVLTKLTSDVADKCKLNYRLVR